MELEKRPETLAVLVVGTDTVVEALPARPIQLAHACAALGFDLVVPLSWGDELVAEAALNALAKRPPRPAVLCSCPVVRQRLLHEGTELAHALVSLAAPPVAAARYLRSRLGDSLGTLAFVGRCPSARQGEYDLAYDPTELFGLLRGHNIDLRTQPDVFTDQLPPDRRRFMSLPGGCPTPELLWHACHERVLVELEGPDLGIELAQHLLSPRAVLVDPSAALGCSCAGVTHGISGRSARIAVTSLEPPRSPTPVLGDPVRVELDVDVTPPPVRDDKSLDDIDYGRPRTPKRRAPMAITPPDAFRIPR